MPTRLATAYPSRPHSKPGVTRSCHPRDTAIAAAVGGPSTQAFDATSRALAGTLRARPIRRSNSAWQASNRAQNSTMSCPAGPVTMAKLTCAPSTAICGLGLADGNLLNTPLVVNAAGPWCGEVSALAGLSHGWPLTPTRIQILYLDMPRDMPGSLPVTVDMLGGIYFRPQNNGQQLVVGSVLESDEREIVTDPDQFAAEPDDDFKQRVLHVLHHRLPGLPYRGRVRGYCGLYTINRSDVHPGLGPTTVPGFWVANGFSGHGFKLAPAIGALMAREISGISREDDTRVALHELGLQREPIASDSQSVLA